MSWELIGFDVIRLVLSYLSSPHEIEAVSSTNSILKALLSEIDLEVRIHDVRLKPEQAW
jgi:hypothetical protein